MLKKSIIMLPVTYISLCLSCSELANKEQEEQEREKSNINSGIQLHASPNHSVPDGHTSDQSQNSDGPPPDETQEDKSPDHMPADHLTWNGTNHKCRLCVDIYVHIDRSLPAVSQNSDGSPPDEEVQYCTGGTVQ